MRGMNTFTRTTRTTAYRLTDPDWIDLFGLDAMTADELVDRARSTEGCNGVEIDPDEIRIGDLAISYYEGTIAVRAS